MTASREFLVAGIIAVVILSGALVGVQALRNMRGCTIEPVQVQKNSGVWTPGCLDWGRDQSGNLVCVTSDAVNRNPTVRGGNGGPATGGGFDPRGGNGGPAR